MTKLYSDTIFHNTDLLSKGLRMGSRKIHKVAQAANLGTAKMENV